ncbi:hypothetical protein CU097_014706 [Rhizopus azygosporus]|uniref:Uncharacterized protein n=1 Tax=Rhizopus azygosporus TaxID=86630 RepID=A0A367K758_RHIAZ|nr:hypothetical protein CU097_014706 [Rhizopus azygosporus]
MLLPEDAPASALKRWGAKKFWEGILVEHIAKEESDKVATVSKKFQVSALDLLDDARGVSVSNIRKRLLRTANQEGKSSASTSINNINISNEESNHHDIDNPFLDHTAEERVRSKIMNFKIQTDHVAEIHKQDLLYYGIIDLVPSSSTKLRAIIEESDLNEIIDQVKKNTRTGRAAQGPDGATYQDVKSFAVEIFGPANNLSELKAAIKEAKKIIRNNKDHTSKWKKRAIKLMKQIRDLYPSDNRCSLCNKQSENHFIITFLGPLFKELFKSYSDYFCLQWGDEALQAEKEERQIAQKDAERRSIGKIPDAIMSLEKYDMPFALVEPSRGLYVFEEVLSFDFARPSGFLSSYGPNLIKNLWKVKTLVAAGAQSAEDYLNSDSGGNSSDESNDSRDTVYASPKKQKTR